MFLFAKQMSLIEIEKYCYLRCNVNRPRLMCPWTKFLGSCVPCTYNTRPSDTKSLNDVSLTSDFNYEVRAYEKIAQRGCCPAVWGRGRDISFRGTSSVGRITQGTQRRRNCVRGTSVAGTRRHGIVRGIWVAKLKVHKIEIFFGFDFEICIISLLVMWKY
jgi:hypothetical protein